MPSGLALSGFLVAVLAVWQAAAQAPGDEDSTTCVRQVYPPDVKMLMDTRNYVNLISRDNPHWQALDVDGAGSGVGVTLAVLDVSIHSSLPYIVHKQY